MKRFFKILFLTLTSLVFLPSCGEKGSVNSITIDFAKESLLFNESITLSAHVETSGEATSDVTWSTSEPTLLSLSATSGNEITVTAKNGGVTKVFASSVFDPSKVAEVTLTLGPKKAKWTDDEIQMMNDDFLTTLPFVEGNFTWNDDNFASNRSLSAHSPLPADYDLAITSLKNQNFSEINSTENSVTLSKEYADVYTDNTFLIFEITKKDDGVSISAYLSFEKIVTDVWPADRIAKVVNLYSSIPMEFIPSAVGSSYSYYEYFLYNTVSITVTGSLDDYLTALEEAGYNFMEVYEGYNLYISPKLSIYVLTFKTSDSMFELQIEPTGSVPVETQNTFPVEEIIALFDPLTEFELEDIPTLAVGKFQFQIDYPYDDSCFVTIHGYYEDYMDILRENGWIKYHTENSGSLMEYFVSPYRSLIGVVSAFSDEFYKVNFIFYGDPEQPVTSWPGNAVDSYLEAGGRPFDSVVPAEGTSFIVTSSPFYANQCYIYVEGSTASDYITKLFSTGWFTYVDGDNAVFYISTRITTYVSLDLITDNSYRITVYELYTPVTPTNSFPSELVNEEAIKLGLSDIPAITEGDAFYHLDYMPNIQIFVKNSSAEDYVLILQGAGFDVLNNQEGFTYVATKGNLKVRIRAMQESLYVIYSAIE